MEENNEIINAIKELDEFMFSKERYTNWGGMHLKRLRSKVRTARLNLAKTKGTHTNEQWLEILNIFDYRCVKCGCHPEGRPCKDHITPIYQGGSDGIDNLQPLCRECNTGKGNDNFNWAKYRLVNGFE